MIEKIIEDGQIVGYKVVLLTTNQGMVMLRGVVELHEGANTDPAFLLAETELSGDAITSDAGFCVYPESKIASPGSGNFILYGDDPAHWEEEGGSYPGTEPTALIYPPPGVNSDLGETKARFHCYVGVTWYGNLGVVGFDTQDVVCPVKRSYPPTIEVHANKELLLNVGNEPIASGVLYKVDAQDFLIVKKTDARGIDECTVFDEGGGAINITGTLSHEGYPSAEVETVIATPDNVCTQSSGADSTGFTCEVETSPENGAYTGHVVVIPGDSWEVCGPNVYYPDGPVFSSIDAGTFIIRPTDQCEILSLPTPQYEHTVFFDVRQTSGKSVAVGNVGFSTTADVEHFSCLLVSEWKDRGDPIGSYRCSLVAPLGTDVDVTAAIRVSPTSYTTPDPQTQTVQTYPNLSSAKSNDFIRDTDYTQEISFSEVR